MANFILITILVFLFIIIKRDNFLSDIIGFIHKPNFRKINLSTHQKILNVIKLSVVKFIISISMILFFFHGEVSDVKLPLVPSSKNDLFTFIEIIVITPVLEELAFRYPIRKPAVFLTLPFLPIALKYRYSFIYSMLPIIQIFISLFLNFEKFFVLRLFVSNFRLYMYFFAITFSLLHFKADEDILISIYFLHFFSAIVYSWIRVKLGFLYSILAHSNYNFYLWCVAHSVV